MDGININDIYWGAGGGGSGFYTHPGDGGRGGGGGGGCTPSAQVPGLGGVDDYTPGGGFVGFGGNGGSGILIIKCRVSHIPVNNPVSEKVININFDITKPNNTYELSLEEGTSVSINQGVQQYLNGDYTVSLTATSVSMINYFGCYK